jgi:hypothetical protein
MTIPKRFDPSRPLTGHQVNRIRNARPEDRRHYRTIARDAVANVPMGELAEFYYQDNPFTGNDSLLADACITEALHRRYLALMGKPLVEVAAMPDGWEQGRIDRLKARVKALHGGGKVARMLGCKDMTVYQVLGDNAYYRPEKRAEWLCKIEGAVRQLEAVNVTFHQFIRRMVREEVRA